MSCDSVVSVSDFKVSNLQPAAFEKADAKNGTYVYFHAPFSYKYDNGEYSTVDKLYLTCGGMVFPNGILDGRPQPSGGRSAPSIRINLNESQAGQALARVLEDIHEFSVDVLASNTKMLSEVKGSKVPKNRTREAWKDRDGLGEPYLRGDNGITKVKYVPLIEYDNKIKTNFQFMYKDPTTKNIQFEKINPLLLIGKPVEMVITLFVKRIYVSVALQQYKVQIFLASAIVGRFIENPMSGAELRAARELADSIGEEALSQNKARLAAKPDGSPRDVADLPVADCEEPEWAAAPLAPQPAAPAAPEKAPVVRRVLRAPVPPPASSSDSDSTE